MFVDAFCSIRAPSGTLMIIHAFIQAAKKRPPPGGLCAVAINMRARDVFQRISFNVYQFKELQDGSFGVR